MSHKRNSVDQKTGGKTKSVPLAQTLTFTLLRQPLLLEGEDGAAYEELFRRMYAAVKPVDIIDEMFVADIASLEWDVLRYRRLKSSLIQTSGVKALQHFLTKHLEYELYSEYFEDDLTEVLQEILPKDQAEAAQTLAGEVARNDPDAVKEVERVLDSSSWRISGILEGAQARRAKELVQSYARREPAAVTLINELLACAGVSMHAFMADALAEKVDFIERIDRLTTIAESRRNASLHEIDRRRAMLGGTLRQSVQEIEDGEFEMVQTVLDKGKSAA